MEIPESGMGGGAPSVYGGTSGGRGGPPQRVVAPPPPPQFSVGTARGACRLPVIEARGRELLAQPGFADSIELRRSRLRYVDSRPGVPELILELESLAGRLQLSRLRGATSLWMSAALRVGDSRVKRLEAVGSRSRDGGVSMSMSIDAFELTAL